MYDIKRRLQILIPPVTHVNEIKSFWSLQFEICYDPKRNPVALQ